MKKVLIGLVLLVFSGVVAFCVKDLIDATTPDYAVPRIEVTADSRKVPAAVNGYDWTFYLGSEAHRDTAPLTEVNIPNTVLLGGDALGITFSQQTTSSEVRVSESYSYVFGDALEGNIHVPYEPGSYIYEVRAQFQRGSVVYYFAVTVE